MVKGKTDQEIMSCPVARIFSKIEKACGPKTDFFNHLHQSQLEFLKAIRSLVDDRIGDLEKKTEKGRKKTTKIKVE
jgi:hypothetical protein